MALITLTPQGSFLGACTYLFGEVFKLFVHFQPSFQSDYFFSRIMSFYSFENFPISAFIQSDRKTASNDFWEGDRSDQNGHIDGSLSGHGYSKLNCCPLVVHPLTLTALLSLIFGGTFFLNLVITGTLNPGGKRKKREALKLSELFAIGESRNLSKSH